MRRGGEEKQGKVMWTDRWIQLEQTKSVKCAQNCTVNTRDLSTYNNILNSEGGDSSLISC